MAYIALQKGNCYHCGTKLADEPSSSVRAKQVTLGRFPVNFFEHPVHLHHNRKTEMTIGAVHAYCNAVLWEYYGE